MQCLQERERRVNGRRCIVKQATNRPTITQANQNYANEVSVGYMAAYQEQEDDTYYAYAEFSDPVGTTRARRLLGVEDEAQIFFTRDRRAAIRQCFTNQQGFYEEGNWDWVRPIDQREQQRREAEQQRQEAQREAEIQRRAAEQEAEERRAAEQEAQREAAEEALRNKDTLIANLRAQIEEKDTLIANLRAQLQQQGGPAPLAPAEGNRGASYGDLEGEEQVAIAICQHIQMGETNSQIAAWLDTNMPDAPKRGKLSWKSYKQDGEWVKWGMERIQKFRASKCTPENINQWLQRQDGR